MTFIVILEGHIHGLMSGEEGNLMSIFHRIVELEENDKESIHLLVFLFMQFLSRYNRGVSSTKSCTFYLLT